MVAIINKEIAMKCLLAALFVLALATVASGQTTYKVTGALGENWFTTAYDFPDDQEPDGCRVWAHIIGEPGWSSQDIPSIGMTFAAFGWPTGVRGRLTNGVVVEVEIECWLHYEGEDYYGLSPKTYYRYSPHRDADNTGAMGLNDLVRYRECAPEEPPLPQQCNAVDFNANGYVNLQDLIILRSVWMEGICHHLWKSGDDLLNCEPMDWVVWVDCGLTPDDICISTPVTVLDYACEDGFDNDRDGDIDYPDDTSCSSADDSAELTNPLP